MKILKLRFKNLNSLAGEWCIDFSAPEYDADGIFAITGPTGSGKSTILDAVCLALYGATPRLGKISKNSNEIMSRQTGECFAEVTFAAAAGEFICHWQQHRARKKPDGKLIETRHEIADAGSGKILESKKRQVAAVIEQKTGMNFERFTRSILLAQGGFDTFLKADSDNRAPILEQITGSGIYSDISKKVHERQRDEREKLKLLQAETNGIAILSTEQEAGLNRELEERLKTEKHLAAQHQEITDAVLRLDGIAKLRREIATLTREEAALEQENTAFQPERERLDRARKAAEFAGEFAALSAIRQQQKADQEQFEKITGEIPAIEKAVAAQKDIRQNAASAVVKAKTAQKTTGRLLQQVRLLDQQISDRKKAITTQENESQKLQLQIKEQAEIRRQLQIKLSRGRQEIKGLREYRSNHQNDAILITQLAGFKEKITRLQEISKRISAVQKTRRNAARQWQKASDFFATETLALNKQQKKHLSLQEQVQTQELELRELLKGRLLREYRTEKENLLQELILLHKISELESERAQLEDGKPCPLCGAEKHPFAEANIPEISPTEKKIAELTQTIGRAEELENAVSRLEDSAKETAAAVIGIEKRVAEALNEKQNCEKTQAQIATDIQQLQQQLQQARTTLLSELKSLAITDIPEKNPGKLLKELEQRQGKWLEIQEKASLIEQQNYDLVNEIKKVEAIIATHNHNAADKKTALAADRSKYDRLIAKRRELFDEKKPEVEEVRLEKALAEAEADEKSALKARDKTQQTLNSAQIKLKDLKESLKQRALQLQEATANFVTGLKESGFADEAAFLADRLDPDKRNRLNLRALKLDKSLTELKARKQAHESRLNKELAREVTAATLADLLPEKEKLSRTLQEIRDEIGGLKQRLLDNHKAREKIREKQALIEAQKREFHKWDKLHNLIGSADGKKFRNFAQGLTFELMVAHANRRLEKMTDRYLLLRDEQEPLELNVVDNYQAGEIRSTKNLSGGESFIVSLALALGLAKMASRKVRVDSLFLDEGFGTLDEESLETALETLSGLRQDNKLIGIISHVPALKERIATQITITPDTGGKSTINGPGCKKL